MLYGESFNNVLKAHQVTKFLYPEPQIIINVALKSTWVLCMYDLGLCYAKWQHGS